MSILLLMTVVGERYRKKLRLKKQYTFFVTFLSLAIFQLGGGAGPQAPAPGYAYVLSLSQLHALKNDNCRIAIGF